MSVCVIYIPSRGVKHVSVTIPITTEHLGPYEIDASTINPDQPIDTAFTQTLDFAGSGTVGAFPFGFGWQQSPGFFNSTTTPSSGFFNSGAGGASGFLNDAAAAVSGLGNVFTETSGFFNAGGVGNSGLPKLRQPAVGLGEPRQYRLRFLQHEHAGPRDPSPYLRLRQPRSPTLRHPQQR